MGQGNSNTGKRKWKQLSEKERYQIEILAKEKKTVTEIGRSLERDRRTIERELKRGSVVQRDSELREKRVYLADVGQRVHAERGANKGRGL